MVVVVGCGLWLLLLLVVVAVVVVVVIVVVVVVVCRLLFVVRCFLVVVVVVCCCLLMSVVSFGCCGCCLLFLGCCSCCGCCCGWGCCRACGVIVGVLLIRIKTVFWLHWNYSGDIVFSRRDSLVRCAAGDAHYFSLGVDDALLHLAHEKPNVFTEELKFPMHLCPYLLGMLHSS